jgi:hypothetical protein
VTVSSDLASPRLELDEAGLWFDEPVEAVLDVVIGDHRVWSFAPGRDGRRTDDSWLVAWPVALQRLLHGRGRVLVREHLSGRVLFDGDVHFDGDGTLAIVDASGAPLSVEKTGGLKRAFADGGQALAEELVDEVVRLLDFLNTEAGGPAFLCYGALLGAVRDGHLIGHDNDADVAFLSAHEQPADIVLESLHLERLLQRHGWPTRRMSGDDFKVYVQLGDGSSSAIDIFGAFYIDDVFHLLGEVRGELPKDALLPLGSVQLEGRTVTAPARPEQLLALTYGPGWREPDPAFQFQSPRSTNRRFRGWFRGERDHLRWWNDQLLAQADTSPEPSEFAGWVEPRLDPRSTVADVGAGRGADAAYLAEHGHTVRCLDYTGAALEALTRLERSWPGPGAIEARPFNLYDVRRVLASGALAAREAELDAVYCHAVLNWLNDDGRRNLWLFSRMTLRGGGALYVEFDATQAAQHDRFRMRQHRGLSPQLVAEEIVGLGGVVESSEAGPVVERAAGGDTSTCRLIARWS